MRYNFDKGGPIFAFFTVKIHKGSVKEVWIKTITSPQICCRTTLWKVSGHQYTFTLILARIVREIHVRRHLFYEFLFVYIFFSSWKWRHCDIIAIFCLLHYSFISVMKINIWHSIKQRTIIETSVDQWSPLLKTCICTNSGYFKHMV